MSNPQNNPIKRSEEITRQYFELLDKHLSDVVQGNVPEMMELNEIASTLCISHTHLTDTITDTMGHHPCYFYELKIIGQAKQLLMGNELSVAKIARKLTYDPPIFPSSSKKSPGKHRASSANNNEIYKVLKIPKSSP